MIKVGKRNSFKINGQTTASAAALMAVILAGHPLMASQSLVPAHPQVGAQQVVQPLTNSFKSFPSTLKSKIKYVIVLYPENRSFDSLYGSFPGANGWSNATNYTQYGRTNNTALTNLIAPNMNGLH